MYISRNYLKALSFRLNNPFAQILWSRVFFKTSIVAVSYVNTDIVGKPEK